MNTGSQRSVHHQNKRRQEAREWFVIRQPHRDLPPALQKKWERWVADDRNLTLFREYERVDIVLRALPRRPLPTDEQLHAARRAAAPRPAAAAAAAEDPALRGLLARFRDTVSVMALSRVSIAIASAALIAGIAIFAPNISSKLFPTKTHTYQTLPGHLLTVTLPDHSVIKLGGASRLSLLVSNETRHVTLYEGEAMFDVTHNPQAPFEVDIDATRVTDIGTAFHIRRYTDKQVIVEVVKGRVDVAPRQTDVTDDNASAAGQATTASSNRLTSVRVTEGEAVSSDATGRITPAYRADFQAIAWWLYGRRVYRENPLGRVIEDLQLYFSRQIEFDRTQVGSMPFTGILDPNNPEESLRGLAVVLPVEIDESDPQRVVIRCRRGGCRVP